MEPLFEAKAAFENQEALYHIFRLSPQKYKAQLIDSEDTDPDFNAPTELIISKLNGSWESEDRSFDELGATLGGEIDMFNSGYGDMLGRIGSR